MGVMEKLGLKKRPDLLIYYLTQESRSAPYIRMGPFTFESICQLFKEEQIDMNTLIWCNAKITGEDGKKARMDGYRAIKDMSSNFISDLHQIGASVPDRRTQPSAPAPRVEEPWGDAPPMH